LAAARKLGVEQATTPFVCFLDDDIFLPHAYLSNGIAFLEASDAYFGVGGGYRDKLAVKRSFISSVMSRFFGIFGMCRSNVIKPNSWTDHTRGDYQALDSDAEWLHGCNGVYRNDPLLSSQIENTLERWSFLEDAILGYRLTKVASQKLFLMSGMRVFHDSNESEGRLKYETIAMRVLYRFVFWKEMRADGNSGSAISFVWSMVGNLFLLLKQDCSYDCFKSLVRSYGVFFIHHRALRWDNVNEYIFTKS